MERYKEGYKSISHEHLHPRRNFGEIATELDVTTERARQLVMLAMRKFKRHWRIMYGTEPPLEEITEPWDWNCKERRVG
jgi:hypothetical protein